MFGRGSNDGYDEVCSVHGWGSSCGVCWMFVLWVAC